MPRKLQTIYELLAPYSEEQINNMLTRLSNRDMELLRARYGNDLKNPVTSDKWNQNLSQKFYALVPKMKFLLENPEKTRKHTIYTLLNAYTKAEIDYMLTFLSPEEMEIMTFKYGEDLENPVVNKDRNNIYYYNFYYILVPKMKKILEEIRKSINNNNKIYELVTNDIFYEEDINEIKEVLDKVDIKQLFDLFTIREVNVILLKLQYDLSYLDIAKMFGVSESEVIETFEKSLPVLISNLRKLKNQSKEKTRIKK